MALAAVLFALSPNLLAHGSLATMEMPLVAGSAAMFYGFWSFLQTGKKRDFWGTAAVGGLVMSCKFTTMMIPPILGLLWLIDLGLKPVSGENPGWVRYWFGIVRKVGFGMVAFVAVMVAANLVVTGFATIPLSGRQGSHPFLEGKVPPRYEKLAEDLFATLVPSGLGWFPRLRPSCR